VTTLAILSELVTLILQVDECPVLAITLQDDATALTAITAIRSAKSDELLTTEVARTCTTVTRTGKYLHIIYEIRACHIILIFYFYLKFTAKIIVSKQNAKY
jgi:hypothetical protein